MRVGAENSLKVAVGARGAYENQISEVGNQQGFFKHGLELEVLYTQGGGESLQAVISGSVDIGISIGTLGALGAYAKGARSARSAHRWLEPMSSGARGFTDQGA